MQFAFYFQLPVVFPEGVHLGAGGDSNRLTIARDGMGHPVLNGSSVAGVLRSIYWDHLQHQDPSAGRDKLFDAVGRFFGFAYEGDRSQDQPSSVKLTNYPLDLGLAPVASRTHHLRIRHRGTVADGGLFSIEACPPGTSATIGLWVFDEHASKSEIEEFLRVISAALQRGVCFGGNSNRGIGSAVIQRDQVQFRLFDLSSLEDHADFLDAHRAWCDGKSVDGLKPFHSQDSRGSDEHVLSLEFSLCIPPGQDLLIAEGTEGSAGAVPQTIVAADGQTYWKLPGSTLRGAIRDWVSRLAARQGFAIRDSSAQYQEFGETSHATRRFTGDNLGWGFVDEEDRDHDETADPPECPILSLFGSFFGPGRIKISDGLARSTTPTVLKNGETTYAESQPRTHVAVDRITGGAAQGLLFSNHVLTAYPDGSSPTFEITIRVEDPVMREAQWLRAALVALDLGMIRIGSSKSSGRLALSAAPRATGKCSECFADLKPSDWNTRTSS